tara:strand:+ start:891 stop:1349 length:459 start_codon:yes stop_codon:yes gene_type:complete
MRWLGIDIGQRRYGVAISDENGGIAYPLTTLSTEKGGAPPIKALVELVAERGVAGIVVGLPERMDGSHGPEARNAEIIAEQLRIDLGVRVELWDERLTTAEAERLLIMAGVRRTKRRGATDRIAAAIILQSFLDRQAINTLADLETKLGEDE